MSHVLIERPGFLYKGDRYFSKKVYLDGTHRARNPAETLNDIEPLLGLAGVTRLADITGLDTIGVPVTLSIRPNSRTLAVSSGKGLDLSTAMVSGAMESLELHHAEFANLERIYCTYNDLRESNLCIPVEELPLREGEMFNLNWPETWTLGWDIIGQKSVAVPLQTALMAPDLTLVRFPSIAAFVTDSNGLASGNDLVEAVLSGLFEVIERDAIAIHKLRSEASRELCGRIDNSTVPYESFQRLMRIIERSGSKLALYDCTSDVGIPTFRAAITNKRRGVGQIVEGFGTHLSSEIAILRAVTEACQGRAVVIAGARDDVFHFALERVSKSDHRNAVQAIDEQPGRRFRPNQKPSFQHLDQDVETVVGLLRSVGASQIIVVELKLYDCEQAFIKVIVPKLESYPGSGYRPRARALSMIHEISLDPRHSTVRDALFHSQAGGEQR